MNYYVFQHIKKKRARDDKKDRIPDAHQKGSFYGVHPSRLPANCAAPRYPNGTNSMPSEASDTVPRSSTRSSPPSPTRQVAVCSAWRRLAHRAAYLAGESAQQLRTRAAHGDAAVHSRAVPTPSRAHDLGPDLVPGPVHAHALQHPAYRSASARSPLPVGQMASSVVEKRVSEERQAGVSPETLWGKRKPCQCVLRVDGVTTRSHLLLGCLACIAIFFAISATPI